jgi:tRNA A-37 threonylcarbamoyl transferase component Bud32
VDEEEHPLTGGNATSGVVRVGSTVRKPWTSSSASVIEFMAAVQAAGVDVPAVFGRDELGRQVLEFVPGRLAHSLPPLTLPELSRAGRLVRAIHDASRSFQPKRKPTWETLIPAPADELICHNDLAPWNLILGERWIFIDWDGAGPSTRLWDLSYAPQAFTLANLDEDPGQAGPRLAAFVDGYGADRALREALPSTMARRTAAMHELLHSAHLSGRQPWGSMYTNGHGQYWRAATRYVAQHRDTWEGALLKPAR